MLAHLVKQSETGTLKFINIDAGHQPTMQFYRHHCGEPFLYQFEMDCVLG